MCLKGGYKQAFQIMKEKHKQNRIELKSNTVVILFTSRAPIKKKSFMEGSVCSYNSQVWMKEIYI